MGSLTRDAVREYDRTAIEAGIPGPVLMENAAAGAVRLLLALGVSGPVSIVSGKGNNGGDGFVIARLLYNLGVDVAVEMTATARQLTGDAATAFAPLEWIGVPLHAAKDDLPLRLRHSEWIIDAVLGTGIKGEVREPYSTVITSINSAKRRTLAIDLPSGLDCDTGKPMGSTILADHTATFVARKRGFDNRESRQYTGTVHVIPIGAGELPIAMSGYSQSED